MSRFWSKPCSYYNNPKADTVLFSINIIAAPSTNSKPFLSLNLSKRKAKEKQKVARNMMRALHLALAMAVILFLLQLQPNVAGRILHEKQAMVRGTELKLQSLQRVSIPPSGPSGCTFIPGTNGPGCPLNERHYAANRSQHLPSTHRHRASPVRAV